MFRTALRRVLNLRSNSVNGRYLRPLTNPNLASYYYYSTNINTAADSQPFDQNVKFESTVEDEFKKYSEGEGEKKQHRRADDEQYRVLSCSLRHVPTMGWTEAALIAGAREAGVSPSIVGALPRKEAALVEFFMDECLQKLIDTIDSDKSLKDLIPSERISKLVRVRLEMQVPFISKWAQALGIQAQPQNIPSSFTQRALLVDEIWHAAGDNATDIDWYAKRTMLGAIYSTTEVYMLTDSSPDFRDTWAFLDHRVKDAFDLRKTFQEAKYLAEAVGAGIMKNVFQR